MNINEDENPKETPAVKPMLHRDLEGQVRRYVWTYRQVVGILGVLQGSTRPDIATSVHQCTRFCNDPKLSHGRAIRRIGKYLNVNKDKGIVLNPIPCLGLEYFADADFAKMWNETDPNNAWYFFREMPLYKPYSGNSNSLAATQGETSQSLNSDRIHQICSICVVISLKIHCKYFSQNTNFMAIL